MMIGRPKSEIRARVSLIRADLLHRYDTDLLRTELYKEQNGICFLCEKPIQLADSVVCEIEHAIPVDLYAEFDYPIEKACEQANDRKNLFAAHRRCNQAKKNRDYEEWIERGGKERLREVPDLSEEEIAKFRKAYTQRSSVGGRKSVENSTGMFAPGYDKGTGGRIGGRISGRMNVKSGHLASLRTREHQSAAARRRIELYGSPATPESRARAGRITSHLRWHAKRGIVNPNCELCKRSEGAQ